MKRIKINKQIVTTLGITALLIACPSVLAFAADGSFDPNAIGREFWSIVRVVAKWGCLIMCAITVLKSLGTEDAKGLTKIVVTYLFIYLIIVMLPGLFDYIDNKF